MNWNSAPSWTVQLVYRPGGPKTALRPLCTASLIAPGWLLSAAHCLRSPTWALLPTSTVTMRTVPGFWVPHPEFDPTVTEQNDLALFRLLDDDRALQMPVCLAKRMPEGAARSSAAGFGGRIWESSLGFVSHLNKQMTKNIISEPRKIFKTFDSLLQFLLYK